MFNLASLAFAGPRAAAALALAMTLVRTLMIACPLLTLALPSPHCRYQLNLLGVFLFFFLK